MQILSAWATSPEFTQNNDAGKTEPPVRSDARGDRSATLQAPFRLKPAGGKGRLAPKFERYELVTGAGTYDLAVSKEDRELVRHVFGGGAGLG